MNYIITLDLGTTHLKANLFSPDGVSVRKAYKNTPYIAKAVGISEIDPAKTLEIVAGFLDELSSEGCPIDAVVVSGMASSVTPVDKKGMALYPCICWDDQRGSRSFGKDITPVKALLQQYPLPAYPFYRFDWFERNHPEIMNQVHKWLNITDYINFHLQADKKFVTDYSIAARTMLFDSWRQCWNKPLLEYLQIPVDQLPEPKLGGTVVGSLAKQYAKEGLKEAKLIMGGHDHMCALLASGVGDPSKALNSTGTAEVIVFPFGSNKDFPFYEGKCNLEHHVVENECVLIGFVSRTGQILEWANRFFDVFKWEEQADFMDSLAYVDYRPFFVPPYRRMLPYLTGGFSRVQCGNTGQDLSLAVLEGVCFEGRDLIKQVNAQLNIKTESVTVVGGLANSLPLMHLKAAILGIPLEIIYDIDMTSLGAFVLCSIALHGGLDSGNCADSLLANYKSIKISPDPKLADIYEARFQQYLRERQHLSLPTVNFQKEFK